MELTAEEKAEARQQAVRRYQDEELRKLQNRTKPTKAKTETQVQPSLFDFGLWNRETNLKKQFLPKARNYAR